jgi:hypothetical protein
MITKTLKQMRLLLSDVAPVKRKRNNAPIGTIPIIIIEFPINFKWDMFCDKHMEAEGIIKVEYITDCPLDIDEDEQSNAIELHEQNVDIITKLLFDADYTDKDGNLLVFGLTPVADDVQQIDNKTCKTTMQFRATFVKIALMKDYTRIRPAADITVN